MDGLCGYIQVDACELREGGVDETQEDSSMAVERFIAPIVCNRERRCGGEGEGGGVGPRLILV